MVSTSGSHLLPEDAIETLINRLLPVTTILTPNIPEAKLLLKTAGVYFDEPRNVEGIVELVKSIQKLGPQYVLLKGGHLPLTEQRTVAESDADCKIVLNVLYGADTTTLIETPYITSKNTHGTGCSLACRIPSPSGT
jgi:hydroxymethylpyrimidine kinase/phosphomethylpyrimidine kinase